MIDGIESHDPKRARVLSERLLSDTTVHDFLIEYDDLQIVGHLGGSAVSEVLKGKFKHATVAVKRLSRNVTEAHMLAFGQEVRCTPRHRLCLPLHLLHRLLCGRFQR